VAVVGDYVYVADGESGLRIINALKPAGVYAPHPGRVQGVAVAGDYAYVPSQGRGLGIVDVSDPTAPTGVAFSHTEQWRWASYVAVAGNHAYVGTETELRIVDVSDPQAPTEVGYYPFGEYIKAVAVAEEYAYVTSSGPSSGRLKVIAVSDPAAPTQVGSYGTPGAALGVTVAGDYVYIAGGGSGLRIIDISDPTDPEEVGFYNTPGSAYDVAVAGDYAYVADYSGALHIVDVSDPAGPTGVGSCDTPGSARSVAVAGDYAYIADYAHGLRVIDVSDPTAPREVGYYDTLSWAVGLAVAGDYVYVADSHGGLLILRLLSHQVYLPLVQAADPYAPVLYPIDNPELDGCYTVAWGPVDGASSYTLEEAVATSVIFAGTVYSGSDVSWDATDQEVATYYYRVKAHGPWGESSWSNVEGVTVDFAGCAESGQPLNPGFEGVVCRPGSALGWCDDNETRATADGRIHERISTPQGWVTWWRKDGDYGTPEVKVIPRVDPYIGPPARVRSGNYAVLYFSQHRLQDGGLYQRVDGLEPGSTVVLTAHAHGWACDEDGPPYTCADPWTQTFQVGIEPNGGTDPFSASVVWSPERQSPDTYGLIGPAAAKVGPAGSVTIFLRARSRSALKHLDAYWDDASLIVGP
jgi:hypothetical protein